MNSCIIHHPLISECPEFIGLQGGRFRKQELIIQGPRSNAEAAIWTGLPFWCGSDGKFETFDRPNLNDEIKRCYQCRLAKTRINVLCGEGHLHAELMLIAQAPGAHEDREGRMFIGPSGKVIVELLATVGIPRWQIYMPNLIKCMLPKNRKPKFDEIATCSAYLDRKIELIHPRQLAPLGYYAMLSKN